MSAAPFLEAVDDLVAAGWFPMPLPVGKKWAPPVGSTGWSAPFEGWAELIDEWVSTGRFKASKDGATRPVGNVAARMGDDQVGIDVDAYGDKPGADTIAAWEAILGPLPRTWVSTSRSDGVSGIYHYRIPAGARFDGEMVAPDGGKGVEFIQWGHRYAVVPPSIHPDSGEAYRWISPDGEVVDKPPHVEDLPALPEAWVEQFRLNRAAQQELCAIASGVPYGTPATVLGADGLEVDDGWNDPLPAPRGIVLDSTGPVQKAVGRFVLELGDGRHPAARDLTVTLERLRQLEYPGVEGALKLCREMFLAEVTSGSGNQRTKAQAKAEWDRLVVGAAAVVASTDSTAPKYEPDEGYDQAEADPIGSGLIDGADWLLKGSDRPEPIWGDDATMMAVRGQATIIAGPQGAGKTTIAQALMLGAMGVPGRGELLGLPVAPAVGTVLFLAADRPEQARLSMLRMVDPEHVRGRLVVWQGPPPADIVQKPSVLLELAERAGAGLVVLDSLKDMAIKLSDDAVGAAMNSAIQMVVRAGIDLVGLHHPRKLGGEDSTAKPRKLDDMYGSTWITSGAGSVLYLHPTGDDVVELEQLKSPNGAYVGLTMRHDPAAGTVTKMTRVVSEVYELIVQAGAGGVSVSFLAECQVGANGTKAQKDAARKRIERQVRALAEEGAIYRVPGVFKGPKVVKWAAE